MRLAVLLFIFHFSLFTAFAQHGGYSSGNTSAIRIYEQALVFYDHRENDKALEALSKALDKDSTFVEAWLLKGYILFDKGKYEESVTNLKKAVSISPDFFPTAYFSL